MKAPAEVWFKVDARGRRTAWYWSTAAFRAFRIRLADAELWVATGQSREVAGHPFKP